MVPRSTYINAVRHTLRAAMCLGSFSSQNAHSIPEVEIGTSPEVLLNPLIISRNREEKVLIETSINSMRISIAFAKYNEVDTILMNMCTRFLMQRAESLMILRKEPIPGYDVSLLITNLQTEQMYKHKLLDFIIHFMNTIEWEIEAYKCRLFGRAKMAANYYLEDFL